MRQDYDQFAQRGAEIIAIGADSPTSFRKYWARNGLPFPGIPDPGSSVLNELGQEFRLLKFGRLPAVLVIDRDTSIQWAHYGESASDIPENSEIIRLLDRA